MNIDIQELEAIRKRILDEVNAEFDLLIRRASNPTDHEQHVSVDYEIAYPISSSSKFFKGKKPTCVIFPDGSSVDAITWKQVAYVVLKKCVSDEYNKEALMALRGKIVGKKRILLSDSRITMHSPLEIDENLFMEAHFDAETLMNVLTVRILDAIQYDYSNISVMIRNQ